MKRYWKSFKVNSGESFFWKAAQICSLSSISFALNHNNIKTPQGAFPLLIAYGAEKYLEYNKSPFEELQDFHAKNRDWLLGYLSYDLNMFTDKIRGKNRKKDDFALIKFIVPKVILLFEKNRLHIGTFGHHEKVFSEIRESTPPPFHLSSIQLNPDTSQRDYFSKIKYIKHLIEEGDCYELNYCVNFEGNGKIIPLATYYSWCQHSPAPFSCFVKDGNQHLICASPERFLKKKRDKIISQPMKGTRPRGNNMEEDKRLKRELLNSEKERSENLMITDLMRNDLAKSALVGTVEVSELFGVYSYQHVHQMISTISITHNPAVALGCVIKNTFPMGSMTGMPKKRVMERIEELESFKRGLFSGSVGYITPTGDFDFNVVIRSLFYNSDTCH